MGMAKSRQRVYIRLRKLIAGVALLTCASAQSLTTFEYLYDSLNQLSRVIDSEGNVLTYTYDQVGNILAVDRTTLVELDPPSIAGVTPDQVNQAEVATLILTGTALLGGTVTTTHPGITVNSAHGNDTSITANLTIDGSAALGPAQLTLTTVAGSDSIGVTVIAAQPVINSISPNKGPSTGGTSVTISGSHFTPDTTVTVGGNPATDVVFVDFETLTAKTPIGPEQQPPIAVDVTVTNSNGSDTLTGGYTYAFGLPYGRIVSAAIDVVGETDEYAFNGVAGDQLILRMQPTSSIESSVRLLRPDGSELCGAFNNNFDSSLLELTCTLDATGAHVLFIADTGGDESGTYDLTLQRTNNPANQVAIAYGDIVAGEISTTVEVDFYNFTGTAGDELLVRIQPTSAIEARLKVLRADGGELCGAFNNNFDSSLLESTCTLDATGAHVLFIADTGGDESGTYDLTLQRTNNPANQVAVAYGDTVMADITVSVELDVFAFSGTSADEILVEMQPTSAIEGYLRVYRPNGTLLCSGFNNNGNSGLLGVPCTLDATGTHYIFGADTAGDETGSYDLTLTLQNP